MPFHASPAVAEIAAIVAAAAPAGVMAAREAGLDETLVVNDLVVRVGRPSAKGRQGSCVAGAHMRASRSRPLATLPGTPS